MKVGTKFYILTALEACDISSVSEKVNRFLTYIFLRIDEPNS